MFQYTECVGCLTYSSSPALVCDGFYMTPIDYVDTATLLTKIYVLL